MTDKQKSEVRATAAALETLDMGGVADLVRRQYAELETLRAGYTAARLEIESLQRRVQEVGAAARREHERAATPTAQQVAPAHKDSTPELHIGDSAFESWYSTYSPVHKSDKQRARDAYAAGMGDPLVTAAPAAVAVPMRATKAVQQLGAGDAVFAFASMLTALPRVVPFGSSAWATPGAELATAFNAANGLSVSLDFPSEIVFPKVDGDLLAVIEKAAAPKPASPSYMHADVLEAHTNGYELGMRQQDRATKPAPAAQGDALDAARYRFLRDGEWRDTDLEPFIRLQLNTLWDAKIDAARAAQEGK